MDADHVDVLTRTLTRTLSRRVTLGGLAMGGMLALSPALDPRTGLARKGKRKKRKFKTVTRTFTNSAPIIIPEDDPTTPYPSLIEVSGFTDGKILDVNITLHRITHNDPADMDVLLAADHLPGLNALVMREIGDGNEEAVDLTLTLDDQAAQPIPKEPGALTSGTFRPTNAGAQEATLPPPAPPFSGRSDLAVFNNADPNGTWQLFVVDGGDSGVIAGWSLQITAKVRKKRKKKR
jgi:hypothetical protein